MTEHFLYLTTTGRTTGEPRQIEIWFTEHAGRHYLVSEKREKSGWVKNIEHTPTVSFSVGTREDHQAGLPARRARARIVRARRSRSSLGPSLPSWIPSTAGATVSSSSSRLNE